MDLSKYYAEISKEPLISKLEEEDLFKDLSDPGISEKEKKKIKDRIIRSNMRFVFRVAKKYSKNEPDMFKELISAGNEGLIVGLEKFKPTKGVRYLSYAGHWVLQRILKEMSKMRIVSLPIYRQQTATKIQKLMENREVELTFDELKTALPNVPEKELRELSQTRYLTYYLDDMSDDPAFEIDPIGTEVETRLDRERIHNMISSLPSPHKEIITLSFGILDEEEVSHSNIAKQLGITKDELKEFKREGLDMLKIKLQGC